MSDLPVSPDSDASVPRLLELLAEALVSIDRSGEPYKSSKPPYREYRPGVGPYSETQLCARVARYLAVSYAVECRDACTRRLPDLLIPSRWAIELKIARPFGDNDKEAEHWSQNLLHPYAGNTSSLSDVMKLQSYTGEEQPVVVVVGYEHANPRIRLDPLVESFETIARNVLSLPIGERHYHKIEGLVHPVHQVARVWAWRVLRP